VDVEPRRGRIRRGDASTKAFGSESKSEAEGNRLEGGKPRSRRNKEAYRRSYNKKKEASKRRVARRREANLI